MITLKYWNSLSNRCRQHILNIVTDYGTYSKRLIEEYHHNFDFDAYGRILKIYLNSVYLTRDHKIKIVTEILPKFASKK